MLGAAALMLSGCGTSGGGPGTGDPCFDGCSKLYDNCQKVLVDANGQNMTRDQCISKCRALTPPAPANFGACMARTSCSNTPGLEACANPGGTGGGTCADACKTIYQTCQLKLRVNQNEITESECGDLCTGSAKASTIPGCVTAANCSETAVGACFQ